MFKLRVRADSGPSPGHLLNTTPFVRQRRTSTMSSESPSERAQARSSGLGYRLKRIFMSRDHAARIRNRRRVVAVVWRYLNLLRCVTNILPLPIFLPGCRASLMAIGYLSLLALPLSQLATGTYVDENALQPSQVPMASSSLFSFVLTMLTYRLTLTGTGETLTVQIAFWRT
jgi:hypothetical protein